MVATVIPLLIHRGRRGESASTRPAPAPHVARSASSLIETHVVQSAGADPGPAPSLEPQPRPARAGLVVTERARMVAGRHSRATTRRIGTPGAEVTVAERAERERERWTVAQARPDSQLFDEQVRHVLDQRGRGPARRSSAPPQPVR